MYGEDIKLKLKQNVWFWGFGTTKQPNGVGLLRGITALCYDNVMILSLISTPRHKATYCTTEARLAVLFPNLYSLSHLSNAKYSWRPAQMQTVRDRSPHVLGTSTAVHLAGTVEIGCSKFPAFQVTQHSKHSIDQNCSVSAHYKHTITVIIFPGDDSSNFIEWHNSEDVPSDWLPDIEGRWKCIGETAVAVLTTLRLDCG